MSEINICIPTLNRSDLLNELIGSIRSSILLPTAIWVIDNGGRFFAPEKNISEEHFIDSYGIFHHYFKYGYNLGVAGSWNKFIQMTNDIRIITNDDSKFYPNTIDLLVDAFNPNAIHYPAGIPSTNSFSCFMIPDGVIGKVGLFDEEISPNYAYFEDRDYHRRMELVGCELLGVPDCQLDHQVSSTIRAYTPEQRSDHHRRFELAKANFFRKWGGLPHQELYTTPYNRGEA